MLKIENTFEKTDSQPKNVPFVNAHIIEINEQTQIDLDINDILEKIKHERVV